MNEQVWAKSSISRGSFLGLAAAGAGAVLLGGCGSGSGNSGSSGGTGGGGGKAYNITLIVGVLGDEFYTSMKCGAQAAAKKLGVNLKVQGPQQFDSSQQTPILNAAVQSKPDAILIAPTDKTAMIGPIQSAVNQGIPVITVDTTLEKQGIALAHIGSDNLEGGKRAGEALANAVDKKGKVLVINVKPGISTTDARQKGFEQVIKNYPYSITCGAWSPVRADLPIPAPQGYAATNLAPSTSSIACRRW